MKLKLFDDDVGDGEEIEKIEIDEEFAKRYEHNKTREDLERYEEMLRRGDILPTYESESDSESESDEVNDEKLFDGKFFEGILKIKKKDPILFQKDARLFDDDDDDKNGGGERKKKEKKEKKTYLKDVIARNLIEEGPDFDDEAAEAAAEKAVAEKEKVKSFVKEQEDLRNEVLAALAAEDERGNENGGDGDGFLKEKPRDDDGGEEERDDEVLVEKLDEFFGKDEKLDENNKFLKDFFKNKMWIDKGNNNVVDEEDLDRVSDDEQDIYAQVDFEREFNFRFEETSTDRVQGHSRVVEGSVRKETNPRKEQRKRKKERMEAAELERKEEVKRLKNVKRKELQEKLNKIREVAGVDGEVIPLDEADLEKDFDPDEFDMKMKSTFGEEYYEAEDADPEFGKENCEGEDLEKPDFDKEDELLGLPKNWDVIKSSDGFSAKREQRKKSKQEAGIEDDYEEEEEEEEGEEGDEKSEEGKRKRKRKSKLAEALKKELEEELYKYDYEDAIGDLKTRFKYRKVKPDRYKLSAAEILWLDEQELNQYVSLKKLATYREQEWKVPAMRKQMLIDGRLSTQTKGNTKEKKRVDGEGPSNAVSDGIPEEENEEAKLSRAARRRKNQKAKRLPDSRRVAYGEIAPSKKKSKH